MSVETFYKTPLYSELRQLANELNSSSLRDLLKDQERCNKLIIRAAEFNAIYDISRQKIDLRVLEALVKFAKSQRVKESIEAMFNGEHINTTEDRAVLHIALRAHANEIYEDQGVNVVPMVHNVLNRIKSFSEKVRNGTWKGATGKSFKNVICIGIGGSYLGPEFIYEALKEHVECKSDSRDRKLRFLANVDPLDAKRATDGLNPEETLIVVISKTFTTAETMMNARAMREWLKTHIQLPNVIKQHVVAVSSNVKAAQEWGIQTENVFEFWDWVGGRFSVSSAVGCLPLALHFGFTHVRTFLDGCRSMDQHFRNTSLNYNLPVLSGLVSAYNTLFREVSTVAILPYAQALNRFPAHIQQLTMESLGKGVQKDGNVLPKNCLPGETYFGEPGTNGQHSFYQSLHQGREVQCEFIGFQNSQNPICIQGVDHHVELMCNLFAQADALAIGKTTDECLSEGCPDYLKTHKMFFGDRVSTTLILPEINPYFVGVLLAMYEHRVATQGFLYNINAFDQWGVELGKQLAKQISAAVKEYSDQNEISNDKIPYSTRKLISHFMC